MSKREPKILITIPPGIQRRKTFPTFREIDQCLKSGEKFVFFDLGLEPPTFHNVKELSAEEIKASLENTKSETSKILIMEDSPKKRKFTIKEYKIENAPVGTRFMYGGHSTLLIVTNSKDKEAKEVVCVSESGMLRKIPYGTKIEGIKEAKELFRELSSKIIKSSMFY